MHAHKSINNFGWLEWKRLNYITTVWEYINGISKLVYIFYMESIYKRLNIVIFIRSFVRSFVSTFVLFKWTPKQIRSDIQIYYLLFCAMDGKFSFKINSNFDLSQMNWINVKRCVFSRITFLFTMIFFPQINNNNLLHNYWIISSYVFVYMYKLYSYQWL